MLPGKTTLPAGAVLALASNKAASPSVLSVKQAPAGAAGGVVLAVDGKRTMARHAAVVGRGAFSDPDDDLENKGFLADKIMEMARDTSSLLRSLRVPKDSTFPQQDSFSREVEGLQKVCDTIADGAGVDEDGALTVLLGVHARIKLLITPDNKQSAEEFLLSSMGQNKASVEDYMSAQAKPMAGYKRASWHEIADKIAPLLQPRPTVCSPDEVKMVLKKTVELLEATEPVHSRRVMAGFFRKIRSDCRALLDDVEKLGVKDNTSLAIEILHGGAMAVLGHHKKIAHHKRFINYEDAADDPLLSSLRRLELAVQEYNLGGPSEDATDD